jgi:hypothetical protein
MVELYTVGDNPHESPLEAFDPPTYKVRPAQTKRTDHFVYHLNLSSLPLVELFCCRGTK